MLFLIVLSNSLNNAISVYTSYIIDDCKTNNIHIYVPIQ